LRELLPRATRFAVLINPGSPIADTLAADLRTAAAAIGREIEVFYARNNAEIDEAFAGLVQKRIEAPSPPTCRFSSRQSTKQ
jgi:ABC-type uncharacterized transport system substrate-binding protein